EQPAAHQQPRESTSEHCQPTRSFPGRLPGVQQPLPAGGYYRTEGELCTGPILEDSPRMEVLESKEGGERAETSLWSLFTRCLV
ncbi:hypothetical protein N307_10082, partial [Dryobates pubescens]